MRIFSKLPLKKEEFTCACRQSPSCFSVISEGAGKGGWPSKSRGQRNSYPVDS